MNRHNVTVMHMSIVLYLTLACSNYSKIFDDILSSCSGFHLPTDPMSEFEDTWFGKHTSQATSGVLETNHDRPNANANTQLYD